MSNSSIRVSESLMAELQRAADVEFGIRRVHLRLEVRDYVADFKPLVGGGKGKTRDDVVVTAGLGFSKH